MHEFTIHLDSISESNPQSLGARGMTLLGDEPKFDHMLKDYQFHTLVSKSGETTRVLLLLDLFSCLWTWISTRNWSLWRERHLPLLILLPSAFFKFARFIKDTATEMRKIKQLNGTHIVVDARYYQIGRSLEQQKAWLIAFIWSDFIVRPTVVGCMPISRNITWPPITIIGAALRQPQRSQPMNNKLIKFTRDVINCDRVCCCFQNSNIKSLHSNCINHGSTRNDITFGRERRRPNRVVD